MKNIVGVCAMLSVMLLTACGKDAVAEEDIGQILADFYESGYDYEKELVTYEPKTGEPIETRMVTEGQVFAEPYREHVKLISGDAEDALVREVYYEETETGVRAVIVTADDTIEQIVTRKMPYGYGEEIRFSQQEDTVIDDRAVSVYLGEYQTDIGGRYGLSEELAATVSLEYYIDKETGTLLCLVTDITDLNRKNQAAVDVSSNGANLETALADAETEVPCKKVIQKIYHYGEPTEFEIP